MFLPVDMSYIKKIERKDIYYMCQIRTYFFLQKVTKRSVFKINIFTKRTNSNIY